MLNLKFTFCGRVGVGNLEEIFPKLLRQIFESMIVLYLGLIGTSVY